MQHAREACHATCMCNTHAQHAKCYSVTFAELTVFCLCSKHYVNEGQMLLLLLLLRNINHEIMISMPNSHALYLECMMIYFAEHVVMVNM